MLQRTMHSSGMEGVKSQLHLAWARSVIGYGGERRVGAREGSGLSMRVES